MWKKYRIVAFGIILAAASAFADDTMTNPGFEIMTGTFPDSWSPVGNLCEVSTTEVHSGVRSIRLYRAPGEPAAETGLNRWYIDGSGQGGAMLSKKKGWVSFFYKAISAGTDSVPHMWIIPMSSTPRENTGELRTDFQIPREHIGDGQWHQGWVKYDYSQKPAVCWIQVSPRVVGEGEIYFDDFGYTEYRPATLQISSITLFESAPCSGDSCTLQARIENIGDYYYYGCYAEISIPPYLWLPNADTVQYISYIPNSSSRDVCWVVYGSREGVSDTVVVKIKKSDQTIIETKAFVLKPVMEISSLSEKYMLANNETFTVRCTVFNTGTAKLRDVCAAIMLGPEIQMENAMCTYVYRISPGETAVFSWVLKAITETVSTSLSIRVSSSNYDTLTSSLILQIYADTTPPAPAGILNAKIENNVAVLENQKVYISFVKSAYGYGVAELKVNGAGGWTTMGKMPFLGKLVYASGNTCTMNIFADSVETGVMGETAILTFRGVQRDALGGTWTFAVSFILNSNSDVISCSHSAVCAEPRNLRTFYAPVLYAGEGSFKGHKNEALFPMLEWLIEGERSSGSLDASFPYNERWTPSWSRISIPLMAVREGSNVIGIIWQNTLPWCSSSVTNTNTIVCARFASPNFLENMDNHLLALLVPSVPEYVPENEKETERRTCNTFTLPENEPINIQSKIVLIPHSTTILTALDRWFECFGIPDTPAMPRNYEEGLKLCAQAYTSSLWDTAAMGWYSNYPPAWPASPSPSIILLLYLRAITTSDPAERQGIMAQVEQAKSRLGTGNWGINLAMRLGHIEEAYDLAINEISSTISSQWSDGGWRWVPDAQHEPLQWQGHESVVGTNCRNIKLLLTYARIFKNATALESGLKGLQFLDNNFYPDRDGVPRGAQVWEIPQHSPDGLAAGHAARAYLEGYLLTGNNAYLQKAVYWAKTFLPFNSCWNPPSRTIMRYCHHPIMGATWYTGVWWGYPVQWCGMEAAHNIFPLSQYDNTYPWRKIVEGITIAGMQLQKTANIPNDSVYGCYPDGWDLLNNRQRYFWDLGPELQMDCIFSLQGFNPDVQTLILNTDTGTIHITAGSRLDTASLQADTLTVITDWVQHETAFILVAGISRPAGVLKQELSLSGITDLDKAPEGWKYSEDRGHLYIKLNYNTSPLSIKITGIKTWKPKVSPYNCRLVINNRYVRAGIENCTVTVYVKDSAGNPVQGKKISVRTGRGSMFDIISYPDGNITDKDGICVVSIFSETAGMDSVTAMLEETEENFLDLILNPSFEDGVSSPENWVLSSATGSWSRDTNTVHTGIYSIRHVCGAPGDNYAQAMWNSNAAHYVVPGMKIWFSCWIKTQLVPGTGSASMRIQWLNNGSVLKDIRVNPLSDVNPWTYCETEIVVPEGINGFALMCQNDGTGDVWFDDVHAYVLPDIQYNLLSNASFEAGLSDWGLAANRGSWTRDTSRMYSGLASLKHSCSSSADNYAEQIFRQGMSYPYNVTLPVKPYETLLASMYIKTQLTSGSAYIRIIWFKDSSVLYETHSSYLSGTNDWTYLSKELTVPWNANGLMFRCQNAGAGTAWFDHCQLQYIPNLSFEEVKPSYIKFTTPSFSISPLNSSDTITAGIYDQSGEPVPSWNKPISLSSSSPKGKFSVSRENWNDTTIIFACGGKASFFYRDTRGGNPQITVSAFSLTDTQIETVVMPVIVVQKFQRMDTYSVPTTCSIAVKGGDTIEWVILIKNSGTETALEVIVTDIEVFDTGRYQTGDFAGMDTQVTGYSPVDSWTYTLDPSFVSWKEWGSVPSAGENVKGLRWKINVLGIKEERQVRFRCRVR